MGEGDGPREERLAKNEALFRDLNERIESAADGGDDQFGFVCECADNSCFELIHLTILEYERLRANPLRFVVLPGHQVPEIEEVVEEHPSYLFIKKQGPEASIALESDPRN